MNNAIQILSNIAVNGKLPQELVFKIIAIITDLQKRVNEAEAQKSLDLDESELKSLLKKSVKVKN